MAKAVINTGVTGEPCHTRTTAGLEESQAVVLGIDGSDSVIAADVANGLDVDVTRLPAVMTDGTLIAQLRAATLIVTGTGIASAALTITLPAVAGQFHYITRINIAKYAAAAMAGAAGAVVVTTTNLPGPLAWTTPTALAIGTVYETDVEPSAPIRSSVAGTATTIVAPVNTGAIWRITVYYFSAA